MRRLKFFVSLCLTGSTLLIGGCDKPGDAVTGGGGPSTLKINYGDSILYLRNQATDVIISPQPMGAAGGRFYAFPEGLEIDGQTGAVNVSKSETGMRYKVTFVNAAGTDSVSTKIVVAGLNYRDFYHVQVLNDSLSRPFYNANFSTLGLPAGSFDVTGEARSKGLDINPGTGVINFNQTIRNGFFGSGQPQNNDQKEVDMYYRLQDASGNALNKIRIKLYYYDKMADVDNNLKDLIEERQDMFLRLAADGFFYNPASPVSRNTAASRPRPPCLVILGRQ